MSGADKKIPEVVDYVQAVSQAVRYEGCLGLTAFSRLSQVIDDGLATLTEPSSIMSAQGQVQYNFGFSRDASGQALLIGYLQAEVPMICQRCLEPAQIRLNGDIHIALCATDEDAQKIEDTDAVVTEQNLALHDLIEDELLLLLPLAAYHPDGTCRQPVFSQPDLPVDEETKNSPFDILKDIARRH